MTKQELVTKMQDAGAFVPGKKVRLHFGDEARKRTLGQGYLVTG